MQHLSGHRKMATFADSRIKSIAAVTPSRKWQNSPSRPFTRLLISEWTYVATMKRRQIGRSQENDQFSNDCKIHHRTRQHNSNSLKEVNGLWKRRKCNAKRDNKKTEVCFKTLPSSSHALATHAEVFTRISVQIVWYGENPAMRPCS